MAASVVGLGGAWMGHMKKEGVILESENTYSNFKDE